MLAPETLQQLLKYNFDLLAHQEPSGRRRLRCIALVHIKDGKSPTGTALALRVTPRTVTRWPKWFIDEGLDRVAGIPHYWSTQRLPIAQEEAFRQAVEQLQHRVAAAACAEKMSGRCWCWCSSLAWTTPSMASCDMKSRI